MFQPFVSFDNRCLDRLIALKKHYLVSQSYARGYNHLEEVHKTAILLTDHEDAGQANMHLNAIRNDQYAAVIDLTKTRHLQKLRDMLSGSAYVLYWSVIKSSEDLKQRLDAGYKMKIRKYIETKTHWRIPANESIKSQFEVTFGELFLVLKWRTQKVRLKFEEIERY